MLKSEEVLVQLLTEKNMKISTAESCTGGMVAATIVNVSGASKVFDEGYITYANSSKNRLLGVDSEVLQTHGAVSETVAAQMARGCASNSNANVGISTTGIAGPLGGTKEKPVGLVYIGCYFDGKTTVEKKVFLGSRDEVRKQAVEYAIDFAIRIITDN